MSNSTSQASDTCCPKFDPTPWENKEFIWKDKLFIKDSVFCLFHIPLTMGKVMKRLNEKVSAAHAEVDSKDFILLSHDISNWRSDQYYSVSKEILGAENVKISGTFLSKVFDGPYKNAGKWYKEMLAYLESKGKKAKKIYFYYTTCPKCAKKWGKNYVVILAQVD